MDARMDQSAAPELQLVLFKVADQTYGVEIQQVQRLLPIPPITRIPGAPEFVEGVIEVRGDVVPVVNMKARLGLDDTSYPQDGRVIIVEAHGSQLGLMVDAVTEVFRIAADAIETPEQASLKVDDPMLKGIGKDGERLIVLVEAEHILSAEAHQQLAPATSQAQALAA